MEVMRRPELFSLARDLPRVSGRSSRLPRQLIAWELRAYAVTSAALIRRPQLIIFSMCFSER
jgi:hypothetical protein